MKVTKTVDNASELRDYFLDNSWGGAKDRVEEIESRENYREIWENIFDMLDTLAEMTEIELNDFLWFDDEVQKLIYSESDEE